MSFDVLASCFCDFIASLPLERAVFRRSTADFITQYMELCQRERALLQHWSLIGTGNRMRCYQRFWRIEIDMVPVRRHLSIVKCQSPNKWTATRGANGDFGVPKKIPNTSEMC
jgi:hypothetical protein